MFAAVFFVVFGLNTDPSTIPPVLGVAVVLAPVTSLTKIATGWWAAKRQGIARMGRARTGAVDHRLAALATAYVLLMAILGPLAARLVEPVVTVMQRKARPARTT